MRTHFLSRLSIVGREKALTLEPNFDFYRAKRVYGMNIDFYPTDDDDRPTLRLVTEYVGDTRRYELTMVFQGIQELLLPQMKPLLFLPEFEIEDIGHRQMEGLRYEVVSQYERDFRCTCRTVNVEDFRPL